MKHDWQQQSLFEDRVRHNTKALFWLALISGLSAVLLLCQHFLFPEALFGVRDSHYHTYTVVYVSGLIAAVIGIGLSRYLLSVRVAGWMHYVTLSFGLIFVIELTLLSLLDSRDGTDVSAYIIGMMVFPAVLRVRHRLALSVLVGISTIFYLVHLSLWGVMSFNDTLIILFVTIFGIWIACTLESQRVENLLVRSELNNQNRHLSKISATDPLTGIMNRRSLLQSLHVQFEEYRRYGTPASLVMLDIDHFKSVNDTHGHQIGDQVLTELAQKIQASLRLTDKLARYGGEEFIIILPHLHLQQAAEVAERLRQTIMDMRFSEDSLCITASMGVAEISNGDPGINSVIHRVDKALYSAKHRGRNQVAVSENASAEV